MNLLNFKKFLSFIGLFLGLISTSISQDIITTQDGEEIECKVLEIDLSKVKYRLQSQPTGPIRNIESYKIFMIKYADGTKDLFKEQSRTKDRDKATYNVAREYRPFSLGIGVGLGLNGSLPQANGMLSFGYELAPVPLRFVLDGAVYRSYSFSSATFNFNLHYLFKTAEDKLEFFPELGIGLLYYGGIRSAVVNIGAGLDYRISDLFSIYVHPRYQLSTSGSNGLFMLNIGGRFRFGGKHKKQKD